MKKITTLKRLKTFTEKPNRDLALQFLDSGDFLWNAGIFAFTSKTIIDAFKNTLEIFMIFFLAELMFIILKRNKSLLIEFFHLVKIFQ